MFKECLLCGIPHYNEGCLCFKCDDKHLALYNKEFIGKDFGETLDNVNQMVEVIFNVDINKVRVRR